ncbi:MAG: hypothetical protein ABI789_10760, partial [Usitatibacter sp.]
EHVVANAHLFVTTLTAREIARLPVDCRPRAILSRTDLAHWAERLAGQESRDQPLPARELAAVHEFFRRSVLRVSQICREGLHR